MERQSILILNNSSVGLFGFRKELLEALCQRYQVTALAKDTGGSDKLAALGCRYIPMQLDYHGTNPLQELKLIRFYKNAIRSIRPDVVLTYTIKPNIYGGIACSQLGVPCIANITGLGTAVESGGLLQKITVPLYRRGLRGAQKVFFQNAANRDFMLARHMVRKGQYDLLPGSGVNLERFSLLPYPESDTVDFCFISRLMREKGIEQYLDAAESIHARHPEALFHICGSGGEAYRPRIEALEKSGAVVYHGYTTDVAGMHRIFACTIHPSYYPEGMSNVLLESCACGRPIITTGRPGCGEIVDDGVNGFVVREKDSADLVEKIEKFLSLPWERRRDMGLAGRAKVEKEFDRQIVVQKYLDELEAVRSREERHAQTI